MTDARVHQQKAEVVVVGRPDARVHQERAQTIVRSGTDARVHQERAEIIAKSGTEAQVRQERAELLVIGKPFSFVPWLKSEVVSYVPQKQWLAGVHNMTKLAWPNCDPTGFDGADIWVPRAGAVLYDDFRKLAVGTNLTGRTTLSGHVWESYYASSSRDGSAWPITTSRFFTSALPPEWHCASSADSPIESRLTLVADIGDNDCDIETCLEIADPVGNSGGLAFRHSGSGNTRKFYVATADTLSKVVYPGPTVTDLGNYSSFIQESDFLRVTAIGSTITVYKNDIQVLQVTNSELSGTRHGLYQGFWGQSNSRRSYAFNCRPAFPPTHDGRPFERVGPGFPPLPFLNGAGRARILHGASNYAGQVVDMGQTDMEVSVSASYNRPGPGAGAIGGGVIVKHAPADHRCYLVGVGTTFSDVITIYKMAADGTIGSSVGSWRSGVDWVDYMPMKAQCFQGNLSVFQNNVLVGSIVMDPDYEPFTRYGFHVGIANDVPGSGFMDDPQLFDYLKLCGRN